ncbi:MAG: hypothetical protein JNN15_17095 [Blastocatellia bacterium]|nr:hypothetical protein [Blastocatellia bacterium]
MMDVAKFLEEFATVLSPALIESTRSRKFTLKLEDQELRMEEASQHQRTFIADLQAK